MVRVKVRHLVAKRLKSGKVLWYWQPSAALRKHGFQPRRMPDDMAASIAEAEALNRKVDAWRGGEEQAPFPPETIPWLIRLYTPDERFTKLKPTTQRGYRQCLGRIEAWSERAGHPPLRTIQRKHVQRFKKSMKGTPAMQNAVIRVLRLLLQYALDEGYLNENPARDPKLEGRPPRDHVWGDGHVMAFVRAAASDGHPSMGLAVLLAADLGQREGDILRLSWSSTMEPRSRSSRGRQQRA